MSTTHTAEIISIGDELLIGQVINTNQADIARDLNDAGISVRSMQTIGDSLEEIVHALSAAAHRSSVVLVTGGLGPTHDDVTRSAVCTFLKTDLVLHEPTLQHITELFGRRGFPLTRLNEDQARVPAAVDIIPNALGTAPGYAFSHGSTSFFVMPGVPYEMRGMMQSTVIPALALQFTGRVVMHRTIKTTGIAESHLAEKLGDTNTLLLHQPGLSMAYLPNPLGVRLRITGTGEDAVIVRQSMEQAEENILGKIRDYVYGFDDDEIETGIGNLLREGKLTLAVAESCTGGLITDRLTNIPGSSDYIERGFICYSNRSKTELLGVPSELIDTHGAVSSQVAAAMAEGARSRAGVSLAISTTGIAGPSGGSHDKPVGLVYIGYADEEGSFSIRTVFGNDRRRIKERAAQAALDVLRRKLLRI